MPSFPRAAVRAVRAVAHKGVAGRAREPAPPPLVLVPERDAVTMVVHLPSIVIAYRVPTEDPGPFPMVVPTPALDAVAGAGHDPIRIEPKGKLRAELIWNERGRPRSRLLELERLTAAHERPAEPSAFMPVAPSFLEAMHEAGRTTGDDTGRYAFHRVQVKGRGGEVVATDGKQAYLHGGFRFPFKEDLLVPALPVFGSAELRKETDVAVGRTGTHLVVRAGPWTLYLVLDTLGRFPDVAAVVPKPESATVLELDGADALELLTALPKLPGAGDKQRPVTLDLAEGKGAVVRARTEGGTDVAEVALARSTVSNGAVRVALDRSFLERALRLGCRTVRVVSSERPAAAGNGSTTLLTGPLDPDLVVEAAEAPQRSPLALAPVHEGEATRPLAPLGLPPAPPAPVDAPPVIDPLAEAEALGAIVVEAGQRLAKLVGWLNARRREPRALARAWRQLQTLTLRPREGRP